MHIAERLRHCRTVRESRRWGQSRAGQFRVHHYIGRGAVASIMPRVLQHHRGVVGILRHIDRDGFPVFVRLRDSLGHPDTVTEHRFRALSAGCPLGQLRRQTVGFVLVSGQRANEPLVVSDAITEPLEVLDVVLRQTIEDLLVGFREPVLETLASSQTESRRAKPARMATFAT